MRASILVRTPTVIVPDFFNTIRRQRVPDKTA